MPVIVVGADTAIGRSIIAPLIEPGREVRAFVTDIGAAEELRSEGVKVALGDVTDQSHVSTACTRCFTAVLVTEAASDSRERSFAKTPASVLKSWVDAVREAAVTRVIWVGDGPRDIPGVETVTVELSHPDIPSRVAELDDLREL